MKTLDRYIVQTFLTSTAMWFVVLMSLRIVVDLFVNLDEFAKYGGVAGTLGRAFEYYSAWSAVYFQQLGKAIIVFGALTTLYTMNRTNELTAILASGQSLHRVIWPIVMCAVLLSGLNIVNQELVIPPLGPTLTADRDSRSDKKLQRVYLTPDQQNSTWYSSEFNPNTRAMQKPVVILREDATTDNRPDFRGMAMVSGEHARAGRLDLLRTDPRSPAVALDGWFVTKGSFSSYHTGGKPTQVTNTRAITTSVTAKPYLDDLVKSMNGRAFPVNAAVSYCLNEKDPTLSLVERSDAQAQMTVRAREFASAAAPDGKDRILVLIRPQFIFRGGKEKRVLAIIAADRAVEKLPGQWELYGGSLFCPTDLTPKELQMRQNMRWLDYLSTSQLGALLESGTLPNLARRALLTKHLRFAEPFNSLILLLLVVPFILSRERNLKASTLLGVAMGVGFYAFIYVCQYTALSPTLTAWLPVLLFGPVAVVMLDSVKT